MQRIREKTTKGLILSQEALDNLRKDNKDPGFDYLIAQV